MTTPSPADGLPARLQALRDAVEATDEAERSPDDVNVQCVFLDVRPWLFEALIDETIEALLAALRLREGCEALVAQIEREADAHTYFADNADLRMTASDHAKRAVQLTTIRDDLARVLEEGE